MASFICIIILFILIPVVAIAAAVFFEKRWASLLGVVPLFIALIWGFAVCHYNVGAKDVGVVTSYGRPVGEAQPGFHWKTPWQKVTPIDGTTQVDEYDGDNCIPVRIGDGSKACLSATIRWHINLNRADTIYSTFRSNDPTGVLRKAVVDTEFKSAAQDVMGPFNPIASLKVVGGSDAAAATKINFNPDYNEVTQQLTDQMHTRLNANDDTVVIESITVSGLDLSDTTQSTLEKYIQAVGQTRQAAQDVQTKNEEALANAALLKHPLTPDTLISKCLDTLNTAIGEGQPLPAGSPCNLFGNSTGVGVIAPSTK